MTKVTGQYYLIEFSNGETTVSRVAFCPVERILDFIKSYDIPLENVTRITKLENN